MPDNITIVPLPAKCPELNPQENIWQFMRDNWLSNRIFTGYENLVDHCCDAWNKLMAQPWTIMSVGLREWAHGGGECGRDTPQPRPTDDACQRQPEQQR